MENNHRTIIILLLVIIVLLALFLGIILHQNAEQQKSALKTAASNDTMNDEENVTSDDEVSESSDSSNIDPIEANRPRNDPNYKGYTPLHESEVTSEGWNPREHEVSREDMENGNQRINYDDGYYRLVDSNGYVITYGYR